MDNQKPKKKYNTKPTQKQARAMKIIAENPRMSVSEAKRQAGYAEASARKPQELTRSKGFIEVLEKAGLTDALLAKGHREAMAAVDLKERTFTDFQSMELVEIDPESPDYKKDGRKKQYIEKIVYTPVTDKKIKDFFKKIPGSKLIDIEHLYRHKVAVYTVPQLTVRAKYQELGYKVKGHMAPEKHDHGVFHEPTDEEKKIIDSIFNAK